MASYKIYTKTKTSKGYPLIFVIYHKGKTYKLKTGLHCAAWKQEAQMADGKGDVKAPIINNKLKRAALALDGILQAPFDIKKVRSALKRHFDPAVDVAEDVVVEIKPEFVKKYNECSDAGKKFFRIIEDLLAEHKNDWSDHYKRHFRSFRTKLLKYEPNFHPSLLNEGFWLGYVNFCIEKLKNTNNTITGDSETLRTIIPKFRKLGYVLEADIQDKVKWKRIENPRFGLSWERVMKIASLDLSNYPSATIVDTQIMWLVGAFTGRRYAEILTMNKSNFYQKDGKWRYKNIGKGQKIIDIPIIKEAVELLERINFTVPKQHSPFTVNENIKLICKEAGFDEKVLVITPIDKNRVKRKEVELYKTIKFHTSRHSYGQHIAEMAAGKPHAEKFVSFMLGHASFATTWKYMNRVASSNDQMFEEIFR